jgi:exosortase
MTVKPQATWLSWLMFIFVFCYSLVRYVYFYPRGPEKSDQALLYFSILVTLWSERKAVSASLMGSGMGYALSGSAMIFAGCFVYAAGRLYQAMIFEVLALFFIPAGLVLALAPREHLRSARFIALAGAVVVIMGWVTPHLLSSRLAASIASISAKVLSATVFPVIADGVLLHFGPYSAEVTEACSGMNSIFSLTALSVIYLRVGAPRTLWHIALLIAVVIPVAIITNLGRVILLLLATWYIGEGFAQGQFHQIAGIVMFLLAIALLSGIDHLLFLTCSRVKPQNRAIHANEQV